MLGPGRHVTVRLRTTDPAVYRGGSRNSLKGGGGVLGQNSSKGGGGFRVQVRGNFHILTSKKKTPLKGGFKPPTPPPGSATGVGLFTIAILKNHGQPFYNGLKFTACTIVMYRPTCDVPAVAIDLISHGVWWCLFQKNSSNILRNDIDLSSQKELYGYDILGLQISMSCDNILNSERGGVDLNVSDHELGNLSLLLEGDPTFGRYRAYKI